LTLVIAHRGASAEAPENTLASFSLALEQGCDMIELDVRLSRDGEVVVCHDSHLGRLAGLGRRVEAMTLAELRQVDVGGGQRIPSLADVLSLVAGRAGLDVEMKTRSTTRDRLATAVGELVHGWPGTLVVSSFDTKAIECLGGLRPELAVAPIYDAGASPGTGEPYPYAIVEHSLATASFVTRCHRAGRRVLVWTVDDADRMRELQAIGVDGICSNRPALLRQVLTSR
jgi:glycerophosphoryl diester phosphodiesterase